MRSLELRIPPPAVFALFALLMWGIARVAPTWPLALAIRITVAVVLVLIGAGFGLAGVASFRTARTTVDPRQPEEASALVSVGIYRVTRNPMYLGLVFVLLAWTAWLECPWSLLGPLGFVLYITRFQIAPEERALEARFGDAYRDYRARVRRWI